MLDVLIDHSWTVQISQWSVIFSILTSQIQLIIFNMRSVWVQPGNKVSEFSHFLSNDTHTHTYLLVLSISLYLDSLKVASYVAGIMAAVVLKRLSANPSGRTAFARPWLPLSTVMRTSCNYHTPTDGCSEWSDRSLDWISSPHSVGDEGKIQQVTHL